MGYEDLPTACNCTYEKSLTINLCSFSSTKIYVIKEINYSDLTVYMFQIVTLDPQTEAINFLVCTVMGKEPRALQEDKHSTYLATHFLFSIKFLERKKILSLFNRDQEP